MKHIRKSFKYCVLMFTMLITVNASAIPVDITTRHEGDGYSLLNQIIGLNYPSVLTSTAEVKIGGLNPYASASAYTYPERIRPGDWNWYTAQARAIQEYTATLQPASNIPSDLQGLYVNIDAFVEVNASSGESHIKSIASATAEFSFDNELIANVTAGAGAQGSTSFDSDLLSHTFFWEFGREMTVILDAWATANTGILNRAYEVASNSAYAYADPTFTILPEQGELPDAYITYSYGTEERVIAERLHYSLNGNNIPEPSMLALMGLGILGFIATRRKRQN